MIKRLYSCVTIIFLLNLILETTDGQGVVSLEKSSESIPALGDPSATRACVIGAGYSGLAVARYLKQYGVDFTVFEATKHVGGTWRFDPHIGTDEDGLPLFTSMYKNLRTNTPIQTMEYHEFPFPEGTPSYPKATCFHNYLKLFAEKFDLSPHIQHGRLVNSVRWAGGKWKVTYMRVNTKTNETEDCNFVIVASGEYSNPVWPPKFEGQDLFRGKIMHSHDYKEPEPFRDLRLLVVGAGPSGLDMILHLTNVTSKFVHSHHLKYNQPYFGPKYVKKPDIKAFTTNGVVFQDDSFEEVDVVMFCTGYDYYHPFLDSSTGITKSGKYILPLYQHVVNIRHPSMAFVGVSKKVINKVLDAQAHYAAALAAKKFKLPSQQQMLASWLRQVDELRSRKLKIIDINVIGDKMDQYFGNLTAEANVPRVPKVITALRDFNAKYRLEDLINYRDFDYTIVDYENFTRVFNPRPEPSCPFDEL